MQTNNYPRPAYSASAYAAPGAQRAPHAQETSSFLDTAQATLQSLEDRARAFFAAAALLQPSHDERAADYALIARRITQAATRLRYTLRRGDTGTDEERQAFGLAASTVAPLQIIDLVFESTQDTRAHVDLMTRLADALDPSPQARENEPTPKRRLQTALLGHLIAGHGLQLNDVVARRYAIGALQPDVCRAQRLSPDPRVAQFYRELLPLVEEQERRNGR